MIRTLSVIFSVVALGALPLGAADAVAPLDAKLREQFGAAPFYEKYVMVGKLPVVSSAKVSDAALLEAAVIVHGMLVNREDILTALGAAKIRLGIMAVAERTCDIPEHAGLTPKDYWNRRARGLGASGEDSVVTCGEENLLSCEGDPYPGENILVHEFGHAIHEAGMAKLDATFDGRLKKSYDAALAAGKWKNTYAAENHKEYFAEAVQSFFGTNRVNDKIHNHVNTRALLKEYDPGAYALCVEVFGDNPWQYRRADNPARAEEPHLKNLDRKKLPVFVWEAEIDPNAKPDPQ
jgi:hypothetical protein